MLAELRLILPSLRGQLPVMDRPTRFVLLCGGIAWLGAVGLLLANGVATMPSWTIDTDLASRMRMRFLRDLAITVCGIPLLFPLGSVGALVHREAGALLIGVLSRRPLAQCREVTARRAASYVLLALPVAGLLIAPVALLVNEYRFLRTVLRLGPAAALGVQVAGRLLPLLLLSLLCALAAALVGAAADLAGRALVFMYYCVVKALFYGEVCVD